MKVQQVYKEVIVSVNVNDSLSSCMNRLTELGLDAISVTNNREEYVGMISMRRIRRSPLDPTAVRVRKFVERVPGVQMYDSFEEAARLMIETRSMHLPVYSGEQFKGVVTHNDILSHAMKGPLGSKPVELVMSKNPVVAKPDDSVAQILNLFKAHGVSHVPVVDGSNVVGIVSIRDLIDLVYREKKRPTIGERVGEKIGITNIKVREVMVSPVITVKASDTLATCLDAMFNRDVSCLVVTNQHGLAGIVTKLDFLEPLALMAAESRKITVQFSVKPSVVIDDKDREKIILHFDSFKRKYGKTLGKGTLFVYMKTQGSVATRLLIIQCRLNLRTTTGQYYSSSEAWSPLDAFTIALDRLVRRVLQEKDAKDDSRMGLRYTEDFLETEM